MNDESFASIVHESWGDPDKLEPTFNQRFTFPDGRVSAVIDYIDRDHGKPLVRSYKADGWAVAHAFSLDEARGMVLVAIHPDMPTEERQEVQKRYEAIKNDYLNYPTRWQLDSIGQYTEGTQRGPLSLDAAHHLRDDLADRHRDDGRPVFDDLRIVRQGNGYNAVHVPAKPRPNVIAAAKDRLQYKDLNTITYWPICTELRDGETWWVVTYEDKAGNQVLDRARGVALEDATGWAMRKLEGLGLLEGGRVRVARVQPAVIWTFWEPAGA